MNERDFLEIVSTKKAKTPISEIQQYNENNVNTIRRSNWGLFLQGVKQSSPMSETKNTTSKTLNGTIDSFLEMREKELNANGRH